MIKDIGTKIAEGLDKFYKAFQQQKVLKTMEEVEANTDEGNLASALLISELNNNLNLQPEWITDEATGKITGYRFRGADTVFPFSSQKYAIAYSYAFRSSIFAVFENGKVTDLWNSVNTDYVTNKNFGDFLNLYRNKLQPTVITALNDLKYTYYCVAGSNTTNGVTSSAEGVFLKGSTIDMDSIVGRFYVFTAE